MSGQSSQSNRFIFPFSTCETTNDDGNIAQPYSVFFNPISCIIVLYFTCIAKHDSARLLLISILVFELFHTFSHIVHLQDWNQELIVHGLAYVINACLLYALYRYADAAPSSLFLFYLLGLVCFDIYAVTNLPMIFYVANQFVIFVSLFLYYYRYFSKEIKSRICLIIFLNLLVVLFVINEIYNCKWLLDQYPWFPFHIFVEILGIFLFYHVSYIFSRL